MAEYSIMSWMLRLKEQINQEIIIYYVLDNQAIMALS